MCVRPGPTVLGRPPAGEPIPLPLPHRPHWASGPGWPVHLVCEAWMRTGRKDRRHQPLEENLTFRDCWAQAHLCLQTTERPPQRAHPDLALSRRRPQPQPQPQPPHRAPDDRDRGLCSLWIVWSVTLYVPQAFATACRVPPPQAGVTRAPGALLGSVLLPPSRSTSACPPSPVRLPGASWGTSSPRQRWRPS